jgi:hypothetical protein
MVFNPLDYLPFGRSLDPPTPAPLSEVGLRTACGRAYYAAYLYARERLSGIGLSVPKGQPVHQWLQQRLRTAKNNDIQDLGRRLTRLADIRSGADYTLDNQATFHRGYGEKAVATAEQWIKEFGLVSDAQLKKDIRVG